METSLKTGFAQIFSRCPKNLSCPKFGGGGAPPPPPPPPPLAPPARTPMRKAPDVASFICHAATHPASKTKTVLSN